MSSLFSVVIPTYNRADFIKQSLESVLHQTYLAEEIIVVDDGSTDNTADYLASFGDRIQVLRQPNRGPAAARNLGARHSSGRYIAFLDSDDLWQPWTLATFRSLVIEHKPSMLCGAAVEFEKTAPLLKEASLQAEQFRDYLETAREPGFVGSGVLVVERNIFDRVGGFDENFIAAEDHDFYFRAGTQPKFIRLKSPITVACRRHAGNTSASINAIALAAEELLDRERQGRYPGERARRIERLRLLSRVIRPMIIALLENRQFRIAWRLYVRSLSMHLILGRWRFLAGFFAIGAARILGTAHGRRQLRANSIDR